MPPDSFVFWTDDKATFLKVLCSRRADPTVPSSWISAPKKEKIAPEADYTIKPSHQKKRKQKRKLGDDHKSQPSDKTVDLLKESADEHNSQHQKQTGRKQISSCAFMKEGDKAIIRQTNKLLPDAIKRAYGRSHHLVFPLPAAGSETCHAWSSGDIRPIPFLEPRGCPKFRGVSLDVVNADVVDIASEFSRFITPEDILNVKRSIHPFGMYLRKFKGKRPVIITLDTLFDDHEHGKDGLPDCLHASVFQRESLLVRTSIAASVKHKIRQSPQPNSTTHELEALYHPDVLITHQPAKSIGGHKPYPDRYTPHVSAITMATPLPDANFNYLGTPCFPTDVYRNQVKDRMRLSLRVAAKNGHVNLVLCVLGNPARPEYTPVEDIAWCWLEVLKEREFYYVAHGGSWWKNVVVGVHDPDKEGWFEKVKGVLSGELV